MHKRYISLQGFTIVELLIAVVVIAILAAVSAVAYTNIRGRTYDSVVKGDLSSITRKIQLVYVETGGYPVGGRVDISEVSSSGNMINEPQPSFGMVASKSAYFEPVSSGSINLVYCTGIGADSGVPEFSITSRSKADHTFAFSSAYGLEELSGNVTGSNICRGIGYPRSWSSGFRVNNGGWQSWVNET